MRKLTYIFCIALFLFGCASATNIYTSSSSTTLKGQTKKYLRMEPLQPGEWYKNVPKNIAVFIGGNPALARIAGEKFIEYLKTLGFKVVDGNLFTSGGLTDKSFYKSAFNNAGIEGILTLESDGIKGLIIDTYVKIKISTVEGNKEILQINGTDPRAICSDCSLKTSVKFSTDVAIDLFKNIISKLEIVDKPIVPINLPGQGIRFAEPRPSPQSTVPQPPVKQQVVSGGTGFLFSTKDYIITNWHVVKGAGSIEVKFPDGEVIKAKVLVKDSQNDIAVLKLSQPPSTQIPELNFGDSSKVRPGDKVFTIGYPASSILGKNQKITDGIVSSITGVEDDPTMFQITVPIQPGNSGGPLFNESGEVIGITTASLSLNAIRSLGAVPQNVNYAIKSSFVNNLLTTIPKALLSNRGIVVVPNKPGNSLADFFERVSNNIVLIEAKE